MQKLRSYIGDAWVLGTGNWQTLVNPATEEPLAQASTEGLDFATALTHARDHGGPALRAMTYAQRGELLKAVSRVIHQNRDELIQLAIQNGGNTRSDAKFDIDGASGTLAYYGELGATLGDKKVLLDGPAVQLGRSPRFVGQHVLSPRHGVAVHVNAFNFPAWGLGEKAACALLAGMPVVSKPATSTAMLTHRIVELVVEAGVLPKGALSLICGSAGDMLTHLRGEDVLAFTGGGSTAATLRALEPVVRGSIRVNVEADSLNGAILGSDVASGSETEQMFLRDVVRDITQKAGQKCTAIRRVYAPAERLSEVRDELVSRLRDVKLGNPAEESVTMGPLSTAAQLRDIREGIARLASEAAYAIGDGPFDRIGVPADKGYFVPPTLFVQADPASARAVDAHEVFGPVATLMPYSDAVGVTSLVRRGGGGLVCSLYSDDRDLCAAVLEGIASSHGRLMMGSEKIADQAPGPGTVLPQMIHGGPGRAGGGEELGGAFGLAFYSQRTAVQGSRPILEAILGK